MEPRPDGRGKVSLARHTLRALAEPQWSPGLMAGGSADAAEEKVAKDQISSAIDPFVAAMEPRPDGRGKTIGVRQNTARSPRRPQWSPGLMAGGSRSSIHARPIGISAAMEPRPDGRGKASLNVTEKLRTAAPQWSPGLMAGGSSTSDGVPRRRWPRRNGAPA